MSLSLFAVSVSPADGAVTHANIAANSANRMIFWSGCLFTDAELAMWRARGVREFVCMDNRYLWGLGGKDRFTADTSSLSGPDQGLERRIRNTRVVERARGQGISLYLGFYVTNVFNTRTPLAEWFDDAAWSTQVLPQIEAMAGAARALGFKGLALDQELYPQNDGVNTATWSWDYPRNTRPESAVRLAARARGAQTMQALVAGFPGAAILAYGSMFPDTWGELVQEDINHIDNAHRSSVNIDFWDGMTSVDGFGSIQFLDATFYKTTHIRGATWDNAFTYEYNRLYAMFSVRLSNWAAVADRVYESPFAWVSAGSTSFEAARDPSYVAGQLEAMRRWGMNRSFANYTYETLSSFDYRPYLTAFQDAAKPGVTDDERPQLEVDPIARNAGTAKLTGVATDNLAVRVVRWTSDTGEEGAAKLNWVSSGSPSTGWDWHMDWTIPKLELHGGTNTFTITVVDIKGLSRSKVVEVAG